MRSIPAVIVSMLTEGIGFRGVLIAAALLVGHASNAAVGLDPAMTKMLADPNVPSDRTKIDWAKLPKVKAERATVFRGKKNEAYSIHSYLCRFGGEFWAVWSSGFVYEDQPGQHVRFATSDDGLHWSKPKAVMPRPEGNIRFITRGLWVRNGELLCLASRDSVGKYFGDDLQLLAYVWNEQAGKWEPKGLVCDDAINNYPPGRLPNGQWMMSRRDCNMKKSMLIGGVESIGGWKTAIVPEPADGHCLTEPCWMTVAGGVLAVVMRDENRSRRIYRAFSTDNGNTWTTPVRTDFPDARSKIFTMKVSRGPYLLINNPNVLNPDPKITYMGLRIPLCVSFSKDGLVYDRMAILRDEVTKPRMPGRNKDPGYMYPHAMEHDGHLYVIYAANKEDIEVLRISLAELRKLGRSNEGETE